MTVLTAAVLGTLLVLASAAGTAPATAAVLAVVAALATGWPRLLALPSPRGTTAVVAAAGLAAALVVATTPDDPWLRRLPGVLALAVLAAFLHQLLRRDLRPRVVDALGGTLLGVGTAVLAASWIAVSQTTGGWGLVAVGVGAVAAATLVLLLPFPLRLTAGAALVAGTGVAALVATPLEAVHAAHGAGVGAGVAVVVVVLHRLLQRLPTIARRSARVAAVAAPVAASGGAVYLIGRLLVG